MLRTFIRTSQLLLVFVILGIPYLLSVTGGQQTDVTPMPYRSGDGIPGKNLYYRTDGLVQLVAGENLFESPESNITIAAGDHTLLSDPVLGWNTFLGGGDWDELRDVAVDSSGNVYVLGDSLATWGTPINPFAGGMDTFVAKLNNSGVLQWHTFIGSSDYDNGWSLAMDSSGNVYVAGQANGPWGSPINPYSGGGDAFIAKLDSSGVTQWHTFLGSTDADTGNSIILDGSGNIYVAGGSYATWGSPVDSYTGGRDAFVLKLNSSGELQWHTFMGSDYSEEGKDIAVDSTGNIYVVGIGNKTWGTPINSYKGENDAFVAKLNSSAELQWHTFMGSTTLDEGHAIIEDSAGNVYVAGVSLASWGGPLNPHAGQRDAFVAKLNASGVRLWHTFMGGTLDDYGRSLAIDGSGDICMAGGSYSAWGTPINPYAGAYDTLVANLNASGALQWHTFMGGTSNDYGRSLVLDSNGNIYVAGMSMGTWGTPVSPFMGGADVFAAKLSVQDPEPDIKANGSDSTITITQGEALSVTIALDPGIQNGEDADWWLLMKTSDPPPNNWYYFDYDTRSWISGKATVRQGSLFSISSKKVPKTSGLAAGTYTFYFAVDTVMNGVLDVNSAFYDKVKVIVNP